MYNYITEKNEDVTISKDFSGKWESRVGCDYIQAETKALVKKMTEGNHGTLKSISQKEADQRFKIEMETMR